MQKNNSLVFRIAESFRIKILAAGKQSSQRKKDGRDFYFHLQGCLQLLL
jgi:hypothetical protein